MTSIDDRVLNSKESEISKEYIPSTENISFEPMNFKKKGLYFIDMNGVISCGSAVSSKVSFELLAYFRSLLILL